MRKVLFVITKSNWGGAQRYVYDLATALPRQQFDVAVTLGGSGTADAPAGMLDTKLQDAGIRTIFVRSFMRDLSFLREWSAFIELCRLFRQERPDIVHLNSSKAGGIGALAARIARVKKIIFTVHGWPFMERRNLLWRAFAYVGSWATARLSDSVIVVTKKDLEIGRRWLFCTKKKICLIYNGIDFNMSFGPGTKIRNAFPPGARILGTVGELTHNKNQISLIEEARETPDMYIAIVGEGEDKEFLESKIREYGLENRVRLFGFVPVEEVMKGFDIFALPSHKEGLPYVVLEARAAGLPVRPSGVGGIRDILESGNKLEPFRIEQMLERTVSLYKS